MKQAADLTNVTKDEAIILAWFADFLGEDCDDDGIKSLSAYLDHCKVKLQTGMTAGESILAHYRNPVGYDIDRAAMDLRTWPPIADRIRELQSQKAEARSKAKNRTNAASKAKRLAAANGVDRGHLPK